MRGGRGGSVGGGREGGMSRSIKIRRERGEQERRGRGKSMFPNCPPQATHDTSGQTASLAGQGGLNEGLA